MKNNLKQSLKRVSLIALGVSIGLSINSIGAAETSKSAEFDHFTIHQEEDLSYSIEINGYTDYEVTDYENGFVGINVHIN